MYSPIYEESPWQASYEYNWLLLDTIVNGINISLAANTVHSTGSGADHDWLGQDVSPSAIVELSGMFIGTTPSALWIINVLGPTEDTADGKQIKLIAGSSLVNKGGDLVLSGGTGPGRDGYVWLQQGVRLPGSTIVIDNLEYDTNAGGLQGGDSSLVTSALIMDFVGTQIATREPAVQAGTIQQYYRGDKTWQDLLGQVRAATLTGLSLAAGGAIAATDSVLDAFGKLQYQLTNSAIEVEDNTNHVNGSGADHADVAANTVHSSGSGADHADVAANTVHSTGSGADHAFLDQDVTTSATPIHEGLSIGRASINNGTLPSSFFCMIGGGISPTGGAALQVSGQDSSVSVGGDIIIRAGRGPLSDGLIQFEGNLYLFGETITDMDTVSVSGYFNKIANSYAIKESLNTKEPVVPAGTVPQYYRGDKTWGDFFAQVRAATLTGLSLAVGGAIAATDTVLEALGKLQYQVTNSPGGGGVSSLQEAYWGGNEILMMESYGDFRVTRVGTVSDYTSVVPAMTSNTTPSPLVISVYEGSAEAYKFFDKTPTGYTASRQFSAYIKVDLGAGNEIDVTKYDITATTNPSTAPKLLEFWGSNDDSNWVVLDDREELGWIANEKREFYIYNIVKYRYYYFRLLGSQGSTSYGMAEIDILVATGFVPDPAFSISSATGVASAHKGLVIGEVKEHADNAAAISGGLPIGETYRTGDLVKIVH